MAQSIEYSRKLADKSARYKRTFSGKQMNNKGQAIVIVIGIIVIFMILIPALITITHQEARWAVKQKKSSAAFHAAEAGLDRGKWKLNESASHWNTITGGGSISGYTGTTIYNIYSDTDSTKVAGQYKVNITSGTTSSQVKITSVGRDPTNNELRALEVVYAKDLISSSLDIDGGISWKPNLEVHWGPVITYTSIDQSPGEWYPRKYSAGQIVGRDTDPTPLNSDSKEYWAFEDLGTPPQVKLAYYKDLAEKSVVDPDLGGQNRIKKKTGNDTAVAVPAGSGYFPSASNNGGININKSYSFSNSTSVIYTDGTIDFDASSFIDCLAVIGEGNIDYNARSTVYVASVPANASLEYVKKKEVTPSYTYPGEGSATYNVANCGMHGFLYCGGNLSNAGGNAVMVGVIKTVGTLSINTLTLYYDHDVAINVELSDTSKTQVSWKEIRATW